MSCFRCLKKSKSSKVFTSKNQDLDLEDRSGVYPDIVNSTPHSASQTYPTIVTDQLSRSNKQSVTNNPELHSMKVKYVHSSPMTKSRQIQIQQNISAFQNNSSSRNLRFTSKNWEEPSSSLKSRGIRR